MPNPFSTIRPALEKILEAEYFLARMIGQHGIELQFELNAFLSAARSVTYAFQKYQSHVPTFANWYIPQRASMKNDAAMRFFLELRNISQKEGPVSYIGGGGTHRDWSYRFSGPNLPKEVLGHDMAFCCAQHLRKLAQLLQQYFKDFPYRSCPASACCEDGMKSLGYTLGDLEEALGLLDGYISKPNIPLKEKLRLLEMEFDEIDAEALDRLANGHFERDGRKLKIQDHEDALSDRMVELMQQPRGERQHPRNIFIQATVENLFDDKEGH